MNEIDVEFVVGDDESEELQRILALEGASDVEQVEDAGILPVIGVIIAAALAVSVLANVVVKLRQSWTCGVIVDGRVDIIRTQKDCDLPPGTVLVFTRDGEQHTLHEPSPIEIEDLIKAAAA